MQRPRHLGDTGGSGDAPRQREELNASPRGKGCRAEESGEKKKGQTPQICPQEDTPPRPLTRS